MKKVVLNLLSDLNIEPPKMGKWKNKKAPRQVLKVRITEEVEQLALSMDWSDANAYLEAKKTTRLNRVSAFDIDWTERSIFGDEDAANEDIELLKDFSLIRSDCTKFFDEDYRFIGLNAPKGSGKTTMCRLLEDELNSNGKDFGIWVTDSDISPSPEVGAPYSEWLKLWKQNIAKLILEKMVSDESIVVDSDLIKVMEHAKKTANIKPSFLDLFLEQFKIPGLPSKNTSKLTPINYDNVLNRVKSFEKTKIWIFIDEVDQTFDGSEYSINKVSSLLHACRELVRNPNNLIIRTTIKPNVFSVLKSRVATMANLGKCIIDLHWSSLQLRDVVAKRIDSYLKRNNHQFIDNPTMFSQEHSDRENWLISQLILTESFDLGTGNRQPHVVLSMLSLNRPRWMLELIRDAGEISRNRKRNNLIAIDDVFDAMKQYGHDRIDYIAAEYYSLCSQIDLIINCFIGSKLKVYTYQELISFIRNNVLKGHRIQISGIEGQANAEQIANLLYYVGFIDSRFVPGFSKKDQSLKKTHRKYFESPLLMAAQFGEKANEVLWEVHPTFRNALGLEAPLKKGRR